MQNITLDNGTLSVTVCTTGAELKSVIKGGRQRIFTGDERYWKGTAPVLFPVCGTLKDKSYFFEGKKYSLEPHGFARKSEFEIVEVSKNKVRLLLRSNEKTREVYPFDFNFYVAYELDGDKIKITYEIKNQSRGKMWAFFGCHESYALEGDISEYSVVFDKKEDLSSRVVASGALVNDDYDDFGKDTRVLKLTKDVFVRGTAVFTGIRSRKITLKRGEKEIARLAFDMPNLLIWAVEGAPFVCLEAWQNYPDSVYTDGDILKKDGIVFIDENSSLKNEHVITYC